MYKEEKRYVRRYHTYGIMVLEEEQEGCKVWEVYYMIKGYPWSFAFGLPENQNSLSEVFDIAESNFDIYAEIMFNDEED